jgi:mRNA interferase MazF
MIVLIHFPFTDLSTTKLRPALILYEGEKDVVAAFISSKVEKARVTDIIINKSIKEFNQTGLKVDSILKLDKIATLNKKLILGEIGEVGPKLKKEINDKIAEIFKAIK